MANPNSFANNTSSHLETVAMTRYRELISCLPSECLVFREIWGDSTILCLDFVNCREQLEPTLAQAWLLLSGLEYLGLGKGIIFKVKQKIIKIVHG